MSAEVTLAQIEKLPCQINRPQSLPTLYNNCISFKLNEISTVIYLLLLAT